VKINSFWNGAARDIGDIGGRKSTGVRTGVREKRLKDKVERLKWRKKVKG
jgi:hypothetical protein